MRDSFNRCTCWSSSFIALLVFGPRKLPELGRGLGDGIRELKKGLQDSVNANADQKPAETKKG